MKKKIIIAISLFIIITLGYAIWRYLLATYPLELNGNVDIHTVNSSFRVSGRLAELNYDEDDSVKKGDLLAKLDDAPYQIAVEHAKANLMVQQAELDRVTTGHRKEEIASAQATVAVAKADLAQAKLNLSDTQLFAPSDGTILTRAVEVGTLLNAGIPVYAISLDRPVWIRAYIDEVNLAQAVPGKTVYIYSDRRPDQPYLGKIGSIFPTTEFSSKSVETAVLGTDLVYRLRIQVNEEGEGKADALLRQGMPVTIKFAP